MLYYGFTKVGFNRKQGNGWVWDSVVDPINRFGSREIKSALVFKFFKNRRFVSKLRTLKNIPRFEKQMIVVSCRMVLKKDINLVEL